MYAANGVVEASNGGYVALSGAESATRANQSVYAANGVVEMSNGGSGSMRGTYIELAGPSSVNRIDPSAVQRHSDSNKAAAGYVALDSTTASRANQSLYAANGVVNAGVGGGGGGGGGSARDTYIELAGPASASTEEATEASSQARAISSPVSRKQVVEEVVIGFGDDE